MSRIHRYPGTDNFTYTVSDGYNVSTPATVTSTVYSQPYIEFSYLYGVTQGFGLMDIDAEDGLIYEVAWDNENLPLTPIEIARPPTASCRSTATAPSPTRRTPATGDRTNSGMPRRTAITPR